jgi:cytochrome c553
MRHALILAALLVGLTQVAAAGEAERLTWTKDKFEYVATGDPEMGEKLAKQFRCKKCHNDDGISDDEEIPSIAGQRRTYMYKQMMDFQSGVRENEDMYKAMRKLSSDDMVHVAAWYESLEAAPQAGGQKMLVMKVCDSCHDKDIVEEDNKIEVAPILRGQMRQYLEASMQQFKEADRSNDLFERMQSVSHKLTADEISRLSRYYGAVDPQ